MFHKIIVTDDNPYFTKQIHEMCSINPAVKFNFYIFSAQQTSHCDFMHKILFLAFTFGYFFLLLYVLHFIQIIFCLAIFYVRKKHMHNKSMHT